MGAVLPCPEHPCRWLTIAVSNSDSSTLKSGVAIAGGTAPAAGADGTRATLDDLAPGARGRVAWIDPFRQPELVQHGLIEDAVVRVESRAPLGGPVVVGIGRARLAIGRELARAIRIERIA